MTDKPNKKSAFGWTAARRVVQAVIFLLFLAPVLIAGWSLLGLDLAVGGFEREVATPSGLPFFGTLSSSSVGPVVLMDPFATLEVIAASKAFDISWLIGALPVLLVFGIIRGRAFCGWVCPVNFLLEGVDFLRKKFLKGNKLPEVVVPHHAKIYIALGVLVLSAIVSVPVFEILSPISFINKGLVFGGFVGGFTLLAIILAELFWGHRVWCRSLCPLGGFYEVVGKVGVVRVANDHEKCRNCSSCRKACLCDPSILEPVIEGGADVVCSGDCMACGKCVDACPHGALSMGIHPGIK